MSWGECRRESERIRKARRGIGISRIRRQAQLNWAVPFALLLHLHLR